MVPFSQHIKYIILRSEYSLITMESDTLHMEYQFPEMQLGIDYNIEAYKIAIDILQVT